jgi:glycosyltransferase involved in cell wall biosynthesis
LDTIPSISLIVCTHNRADILDHSLSFYANIKTEVNYDILIVANACTDHTLDIIKKHTATNTKIRHVEQDSIGHSNARNAGWKNANAPFVFYIDDDAYPNPNIIDELYRLINSNSIDCISGRTVYWDYNSPKWIKPSFVEVPTFREDFGEMPSRGYINGCACGFSIQALKKAGGFNPRAGMSGKKIGYYDEIYMQDKLKSLGHTIHYSPELIVHHQSHQKKITAFFKSHYLKGKSRKQFAALSTFKAAYYSLVSLTKGTVYLLPNWVKHGTSAGTVKSYSSFFYYLGQLIG